MRIHSLFYSSVAAVAVTAALSGCYTYPVYQPAPIARLTPEQSAAIAGNQTLSQADRDRLTKDNAQVAQQDQSSQAYGYALPVAPVYASPYAYPYSYYAGSPFYDGYPYYYGGGIYPFYPGVSLSFGFRGGYWGHGGYGGFRGHR